MYIKRIYYLLLFVSFMLPAKLSFSVTWTTASSGFWNDPSTWSANTIPPYSGSDTFYIKHPVAFENNLFFNGTAFIKIDSAGGLCGHHNITVSTGVHFLKYGILELDTMNIPGGQVNFYAPGDVIFTMYGVLTNGGSLTSNGCSFAVGPWFECLQPAFSFAIGINEYPKSDVSVFPNPATGNFTFSFSSPLQNAVLQINDLTGRIIFREFFSGGELQVAVNTWPDGMYYWSVIAENEFPSKGKVLILK